MLVAAFVSFFSFWLVMKHLPDRWVRRIVGYRMVVDIVMHITILYMFLGTSTMGLLQAEAAGICFSLYLRAYVKLYGEERIVGGRWKRFAGLLTKANA